MNKLSVYLLNTEECYTLNERLLSIFNTDLAEEIVVSKVRPYLDAMNADLSVILSKHSSTDDLTEQLAAKDSARDAAFISFRDYCKAMSNVPNPIQSAAAKKLVGLIKRIGWTLYTQGYSEQTASQKALIEALQEPEYAEAVVAINAVDWVKTLQAANADFEAAVKLKNETTAQDSSIPPSSDCRRRMVRYLKPLLSYLELMADIEPETYATANTKIAEVIEYVSATARARQTRKENQQAEQEASSEASLDSAE